MAGFKTHIFVGAVAGTGYSYAIYSYNNKAGFITVVSSFLLTLLGSVLPDIDSDKSVINRSVFTYLTILFGSYYAFVMREKGEDISSVLVFTALISLIFFFVSSSLFKRVTTHRGIYHSIPMMLIVSYLCFIVLGLREMSTEIKLLLSAGLSVGFLSHLILDEIFSVKTLIGVPYGLKKSSGSALKLKGNSTTVNIIVYGFLTLLVLGTLFYF